jgi:CubicO group peptidase (beta-lactamase class C family)
MDHSALRRSLACGLTIATIAAGARVSGAADPPNAAFAQIGADALATQKAPGFSFAVVHDGAVVFAQGFGVADVERKVPVRPDTRFAIGSLTKQFTATAILLLAQRGRLGLDDPLVKYLPSFPNAAAITLRMLLNQTSGLHNYPLLTEHSWPTQGAIALDSLIPILATDKPDFTPGARWEYSNTNYALLSAVIAKAGSLDEAAFLRRDVFDPLKMTASGYGYAAQRESGIAKAYQGRAPFEAQPPVSLDLFSGAGAVVSNAVDVAAWDVALMRGTLLDASSMHELWTAGQLASGASVPYAMGFVPSQLAGHREVWHNGLAPGAGGYCFNAIFPDDKLAVIVLSDGADFTGVPEQMAARVLAAYAPSAATAAAAGAPPTPAPGEIPAVTARAKDWWHRLQTGTVDLSQVEEHFAQRLTPELLAQVKASVAQLGAPTDWIYQGSQSVPGGVVYRYWIRVDGIPHVWSIVLTPDNKIAGSQLQ